MLEFIQNIPAEAIVFFSSMLPLSEINGSIPFGIYLGLSPEAAFFWSVLGNTLIAIIALKTIKMIMNFIIKKISFLDKFFEKKFQKWQNKHSNRFNQLGPIFLAFFVLIPLPGSGTYTGVLMSYLFNITFWHAIAAIFLGNFIKGIFLSGGASVVFSFFS